MATALTALIDRGNGKAVIGHCRQLLLQAQQQQPLRFQGLGPHVLALLDIWEHFWPHWCDNRRALAHLRLAALPLLLGLLVHVQLEAPRDERELPSCELCSRWCHAMYVLARMPYEKTFLLPVGTRKELPCVPELRDRRRECQQSWNFLVRSFDWTEIVGGERVDPVWAAYLREQDELLAERLGVEDIMPLFLS